MRTWHYNLVRIVKSKEFCNALMRCLEILEGPKDHSIIVSMLQSYFNLRNKGFTSNTLPLPSRKASLHINKSGIYFLPMKIRSDADVDIVVSLNDVLYKSIGRSQWILTFRKTKMPKKEELLCLRQKYQKKKQKPT